MGLFDQEELQDDVEKSRLFDTVKDEGRSLRDYLKVLLPVVIAVVAIGAVVVYFTMPGVGDEVRPPGLLDEAVRAHFPETEKRAVVDATYFYCKDFYWARIQLEKRPDITARKLDEGHRRIVAAETADGRWQITSVAATEADLPCVP